MNQAKIGRSCDECKARKVRCISAPTFMRLHFHAHQDRNPPIEPAVRALPRKAAISAPLFHHLIRVQRRGSVCHFSPYKQRSRRVPTAAVPRAESNEPSPASSQHSSRARGIDPWEPQEAASEGSQKLFMDFLLEDRQLAGRQISSDFICKVRMRCCTPQTPSVLTIFPQANDQYSLLLDSASPPIL